MPPYSSLFDLPGPVELVLDDDVLASVVSLGEPTSPINKGNNNQKTKGVAAAVRVHFALERNEIYELPSMDICEVENDLWYTEQDYRGFLKDAGFTVPTPTRLSCCCGSSQSKRHRGSLPWSPTTQFWLVRSLWLGSVVMGILATSTTLSAGSSSSKQQR